MNTSTGTVTGEVQGKQVLASEYCTAGLNHTFMAAVYVAGKNSTCVVMSSLALHVNVVSLLLLPSQGPVITSLQP